MMFKTMTYRISTGFFQLLVSFLSITVFFLLTTSSPFQVLALDRCPVKEIPFFQSSWDFPGVFPGEESAVHLIDLKGLIQIVGEDRQDILVEAFVTPHGGEHHMVEEYLETVQLTHQIERGALEIQLQEESRPDSREVFAVDYQIRLPQELSLVLINGSGEIFIQHMGGGASIQGRDCRTVFINSVQGHLLLDIHTGFFTIQNIDGSISGNLQHSQGTLQGITGDLFLESGHNDLTISEVGGDVTIHSSHDTLKMHNLQGETYLHSAHSQVFMRHLKAAMKADIYHGQVQLLYTASPVQVYSRFGDILLLLSQDGEGYRFDLRSHFGVVETGIPLLKEETGHLVEMTGLYGGGGHPVFVQLEHGALFLEIQEGMDATE